MSEQEHRLEELSNSKHYRKYLEEARQAGECTKDQMFDLYDKLADDGESVRERIVNGWLVRIIRMADEEKDENVLPEDLIQEGNMALWMQLSEPLDGLKPEQIDEKLENAVREAMHELIRTEAGVRDHDQETVGKAALVRAAQEYLAKENGRSATLSELSNFTKIPEEELRDILALIKDLG